MRLSISSVVICIAYYGILHVVIIIFVAKLRYLVPSFELVENSIGLKVRLMLSNLGLDFVLVNFDFLLTAYDCRPRI